MQFWALLVDSFHEARDRKIFWVLIAITLLIATLMLCIGFKEDRVTILFGLWESSTDYYSPLSSAGRSHITGIVVYAIMDGFLGSVGMLLMIIATAGAFPAMMQKGAIDVVLAKPIGRPKLFCYKYLGGMVFVLIQATLFVGLTFLVAGLRWRTWVPGYLVYIPLMVLMFSYVYCVSVLVAVITRSTVAAILVTLGAWVIFALVRQSTGAFELLPELKKHEQIYRVVQVVSWIPPKTADIPYLGAKWANAGVSLDMFPSSVLETGTEAERAQVQRSRQFEVEQLEIDPLASIGSSLLFEAVIVLLAMWVFCRQDF